MTFSFGLKGQQIEFDTYLAFEDAAGRRDTVWYGRRNIATCDYDPQLGEELAAEPIDSNTFVLTKCIFENTLLKNKFFNKVGTRYSINVGIVFVNAKYPVKMKMDTTFFENFKPGENLYYKYIGSWCWDPISSEIWNSYYLVYQCIENGEAIISFPPSFYQEKTCVANPHIVNAEVEGRGKVDLDIWQIWTFFDTECRLPLISVDKIDGSGRQQSIYPNPTSGDITILTKYTKGILQIRDMQGRIVQSSRISDEEEKYTFHLEKGIYVASIIKNSSMVFLGRILVLN